MEHASSGEGEWRRERFVISCSAPRQKPRAVAFDELRLDRLKELTALLSVGERGGADDSAARWRARPGRVRFLAISGFHLSRERDETPSLEQYPRQFEREWTLPEPPDYKFLVRFDVEAGATSALPADVPAGTYAVVCFVDDVPIEQVYIAERLDVTE